MSEPCARLSVLGSCGAWPEPGRACSGFLLESAGYRVVLDLGYGTLPRLLTALDSPVADGLDAVVVTHAHPDHMIDLHGLFRARWFGRRGAPRIPLFAPSAVLDRVVKLEEDDRDAVGRVFDWHPLPGERYDVGPFRLDSVALPHFVPNAGVRLVTPEVSVAYTGNTGPSPLLAELGAGVDLFVVEATDRCQQPGTPPADPLLARERPGAVPGRCGVGVRRCGAPRRRGTDGRAVTCPEPLSPGVEPEFSGSLGRPPDHGVVAPGPTGLSA